MIVPVEDAEEADEAEESSSSTGSSAGPSVSSCSSASVNGIGGCAGKPASFALAKDFCNSLIMRKSGSWGGQLSLKAHLQLPSSSRRLGSRKFVY